MIVFRSGLNLVERLAISPDGQSVVCAKASIRPTICKPFRSPKPVFIKCKESNYADIKLFYSPEGKLFGIKGQYLLTFDLKDGRQLTSIEHDSQERYPNGILSTDG